MPLLLDSILLLNNIIPYSLYAKIVYFTESFSNEKIVTYERDILISQCVAKS